MYAGYKELLALVGICTHVCVTDFHLFVGAIIDVSVRHAALECLFLLLVFVLLGSNCYPLVITLRKI